LSFRVTQVVDIVRVAVGRTTFWDPLVAWRSKKATREQAVAEIAGRYREFIGLFERTDLHPPSAQSNQVGPKHRSSMEG
jgi:myo-inositol catabolism protein IolC